jgi:hypothetical protein
VIWNGGGISGESNVLGIFPEQEFVIAFLTNLGATNILEIAHNVTANFACIQLK